MKNSRYYFLMGFITAIITAVLIVSCSEPLAAGGGERGSSEWCPLYVRVVN